LVSGARERDVLVQSIVRPATMSSPVSPWRSRGTAPAATRVIRMQSAVWCATPSSWAYEYRGSGPVAVLVDRGPVRYAGRADTNRPCWSPCYACCGTRLLLAPTTTTTTGDRCGGGTRQLQVAGDVSVVQQNM
jgi:hypothetical protein